MKISLKKMEEGEKEEDTIIKRPWTVPSSSFLRNEIKKKKE